MVLFIRLLIQRLHNNHPLRSRNVLFAPLTIFRNTNTLASRRQVDVSMSLWHAGDAFPSTWMHRLFPTPLSLRSVAQAILVRRSLATTRLSNGLPQTASNGKHILLRRVILVDDTFIPDTIAKLFGNTYLRNPTSVGVSTQCATTVKLILMEVFINLSILPRP